MANTKVWTQFTHKLKSVANIKNSTLPLHSNDFRILIIQRNIFDLKEASREKRYIGRKLVGYSMSQMCDVVADVGKYKDFLPFCKRSDVLYKRDDFLRANLSIGFPPVKENYVSQVTIKKPTLVQAVCTDGRLFDHLETAWKFSPGLKSNEQSCIIDFSVSFQFKSYLYSQLAHLFFDQLILQMEGAFIEEAERRYGKPSTKTVKLSMYTI